MGSFFSLSATLGSYADAAMNASRALKRNWLIVPASAVAYRLFLLVGDLFGQMGFGGGLIVGLIQILFLSVYYCWVRDSVEKDRVTMQSLTKIDGSVFSAVINTAFILFIAKFLVASLIQGLNLAWVPILLQFGIVIVCNALPEVVYQHRYDGMTAIAEAAKFTRENWIEWFIPFIVILIPWFLISPDTALVLIAKLDEMLPATAVYQTFALIPLVVHGSDALNQIVAIVLGIVGFNWYMLFRGFLFRDFETGSRRQRAFRSKL